MYGKRFPNLLYIRHGSYSPSVDPDDDQDFDIDDENDKITWRHCEVEPGLVKAGFVFIVAILYFAPAFTE